MKKLIDNGIGCRPFFILCIYSLFLKTDLFNNQHYPIAENLYDRGFYIPSGLTLDEKISKVVDTLFKVLNL